MGSGAPSYKRKIENASRDQLSIFNRANGDDDATAGGIGGAIKGRVLTAQQHRLATPQTRGGTGIDRDARHFGQPRLDAAQGQRADGSIV